MHTAPFSASPPPPQSAVIVVVAVPRRERVLSISRSAPTTLLCVWFLATVHSHSCRCWCFTTAPVGRQFQSIDSTPPLRSSFWTAASAATANSLLRLYTSQSDAGTMPGTTPPPPSPPQLILSLQKFLCPTDVQECVETHDFLGGKEETNTIINKNTSETNNDVVQRVRLILASQSPRRKEILDMMGLAGRFVPIPSPLDEAALARELLETGGSSLDPKTYTRILAERKALALAESLLLDQDDGAVETSSSSSSMVTLVLGSDTIVALEDGRILEKPVDEIDATRMLQELEGKRHCVHTGVALIQVSLATTTSTMGATKNSGTTAPIDAIAGTAAAAAATALLSPPRVIASFTDTATVQFATLTPTDIATYVATGEPMDKAGSYGIQGIGGQMVTCVEGDFFTVMGLPMHRTSRALAAAIVDIVFRSPLPIDGIE